MTIERRNVLAAFAAGTAFAAFPVFGAAQRGQVSLAAPESLGVASGALLDLLAAFRQSPHELHSLVVSREGRDVARGWWAPYRADVPQLLYSLSKSFTSTAIGLAIGEGWLSIDDRVIDFFPDRRPAMVSDNLAALSIRHLLTMSVGHGSDSTPIITHEQDWARAFLAQPIVHAPGSEFLYDSGASYMLSAIAQKATGQRIADYLRPRLFDPLGIADARWAVCPMGVNTGGWGLKVTTAALARFGRLYLQEGRWNGRQIVPGQWVKEATRAQIRQPLTNAPPGVDPAALPATSDWHQGYGYQFWRCRHDAFRGDGAFGQYCIVLPRERVVVAITSCTTDMQGLLNLVWDHLLPGLHDAPLAHNRTAADRLQAELAALTLPFPDGALASPVATRIGGRRFVLEPNRMGATAISLQFDHTTCAFMLEAPDGRSIVTAGMGHWQDGFTDMPGTPPEFTELVGTFASTTGPVRVAATAAWPSDDMLKLQWRYCETPHHDDVTCAFEGDQLRVTFRNSITRLAAVHQETRPELVGRLAA